MIYDHADKLRRREALDRCWDHGSRYISQDRTQENVTVCLKVSEKTVCVGLGRLHAVRLDVYSRKDRLAQSTVDCWVRQ